MYDTDNIDNQTHGLTLTAILNSKSDKEGPMDRAGNFQENVQSLNVSAGTFPAVQRDSTTTSAATFLTMKQSRGEFSHNSSRS